MLTGAKPENKDDSLSLNFFMCFHHSRKCFINLWQWSTFWVDVLQPQKLGKCWKDSYFLLKVGHLCILWTGDSFFFRFRRITFWNNWIFFHLLSWQDIRSDLFILVRTEYKLSSPHKKLEGEFMLIFLHWLCSLTLTCWAWEHERGIFWSLLAKYVFNFIEEMQNVENRIAVIVCFKTFVNYCFEQIYIKYVPDGTSSF